MLNRTRSLILITGLVLAACAPAATPAPPQAVEVERFAAEAPVPVAQEDAARAGADRIVIKNASLSLLVKDVTASVDEIVRLAESMGGFVVATNVYGTTYGPNNLPAKQASITIRVPAERLTEALTRIKSMAVDVPTENVTGQDVTAEYTDLQSRLTNLEAAERQLQTIMDGATKTEDVLDVYNQLVSVGEQIEVIKGQIKYYEESAAFSQISIDLVPDVVAQPLDVGGWRPEGVVRQALEALIASLQVLVNILIYLVILGVPLAVLLGLPAWVVRRYVRSRRQKAKPTPPAS